MRCHAMAPRQFCVAVVTPMPAMEGVPATQGEGERNYHIFYQVCCATLCYAMLCYAMLCYAMLCYAMLCCAMLCYAVLCCAVLCSEQENAAVAGLMFGAGGS